MLDGIKTPPPDPAEIDDLSLHCTFPGNHPSFPPPFAWHLQRQCLSAWTTWGLSGSIQRLVRRGACGTTKPHNLIKQPVANGPRSGYTSGRPQDGVLLVLHKSTRGWTASPQRPVIQTTVLDQPNARR
ncbi:hypothetical protein PCANC_19304 [Puccinia coronata f. sp. avenae]|uniref:Uncharacterized protein n=1 Tax=Puccinia coronata f. sp. avenae TaxID=200324 RepID=A0A2N5UM85_9BASI|nr:hypothetical protein PCANC_19304 [Puccinia coronata f. sp. avenae]PLW45026.1 hypothetical protein PCASD_06925 [Puccinia coronata f. sp. avenae]